MAREGKLNHLEIYVESLSTSREFWGWLLARWNYKEFQAWGEGISFIAGDFYIVLVQVSEQFSAKAFDRRHIGLNHLAFWARSRAEVDELADQLKKRGVRLLYENRHPYAGGSGHYAVYFEDPNGLKVEVVAPAYRKKGNG